MVAATLVLAILIYTSIAFLGTPVFWISAVLLVLVVTGIMRSRGTRGGGGGLFSAGFLCDRCKYNDERYCSRPERPNATECPEYKAGS